MADGKKGRRKKWPMEKIGDGKNTPVCFFCLKYPAGHALKFKGVQEAEPPGRGLGAEGYEWGGGGGANGRHS